MLLRLVQFEEWVSYLIRLSRFLLNGPPSIGVQEWLMSNKFFHECRDF